MSYAISNLHCVPKGFSIGSFVEIYTTKCNYLAMADTRILVIGSTGGDCPRY